MIEHLVSVDYRRAPEHPLPVAYDDSWAALKWVASHAHGDGPEEWLNRHVDFGKVFLGGDSAGANIAHQLALRFGQERLEGIDNIKGIILVHPYFWGIEPIGNEERDPEKRKVIDGVWYFACPTTGGNDDPLINPLLDPKLATLGCNKVLVAVAGNDALRERGWYYCEELKKRGWRGKVEFVEANGENHVFHLENATCENAVTLLKKISSFINDD
ncbi:hypothetical protein Tsubulata_003455 [Turnera subulata]|uniref:Alpha/beta hydrolase fold-3 domain-containing protein n=1 Tax=Turnera subulata TaxID=218843 RepID=A0A9Q0JKY0_9ROSI|nr:hypothetical protein Tsubulata_003455 [Turnera subulata]